MPPNPGSTSSTSNPGEIAREAFRLLVTRRTPPTPDNYRKVYEEISGDSVPDDFFPDKQLRHLANGLPRETPEQLRLGRELDTALKAQDWESFRSRLLEYVGSLVTIQQLSWPDLISELIRQWELRKIGLTTARKREQLDNALRSGGTADVLHSRLSNVLKYWAQEADDPSERSASSPEMQTVTVSETVYDVLPGTEDSRNLFLYMLETVITPLLLEHPRLLADAQKLTHELRAANTPAAWKALHDHLRKFAFQIELLAEDDAELRNGLMGLIRLILDNVDQLVIDDTWLKGQVDMVRELIDAPLSHRALEDAERRMKDVIYKQSQLKHRLSEAQASLKAMLVGFVDHLADFADATTDYHDKIERCAKHISQAKDISQLETVLDEVIRETRIIQLNAQRSRDDLRVTQQQVNEAETRIRELEGELAQASHLVRFDQLTGVLNRRGMEEMFDKEMHRADRRASPLCVALLDIDNFKKLNDSLGHLAGDAALVHLATVIRETMRPEDSVARFGGEEFIILLPDTPLEDAQHALVRLQRELTRRIFLYEHHKTLITFSAGVTQLQAADTQQTVVQRADQAMYQAKQSGKNRVCIA